MQTLVGGEARRAARRFQALSDETRVRIVEMLAGGELCVCELTAALGAAQSRLSFHLKVLRTAGLIRGRREGRWSYYSLRPEALDELADLVRALRPPPDGGRGCCAGRRAAGDA